MKSVLGLLLSLTQVGAYITPLDLAPPRDRRSACRPWAAHPYYLRASSSAADLVSAKRRNHVADISLASPALGQLAAHQSDISSQDLLSSQRIARGLTTLFAVLSIVSVTTGFSCSPPPALAAPPIAVIAEELGYFPVQSRDGTVTYIPQRVQRESTDQAVQLADYLRSQNVVLAGTYWCPHTSRQKELLGREALARLDYVECAPKGYQANPKLCIENKVDGYPTWIVLNERGAPPATKQLAGERSLAEVAKFAGYSGMFRDELEQVNPPPPIGGSACK